ncbi:MAG: hypothetical protein GTO45_16995 [Candidatus Aminicenantes bacterium]|nr:hypothetical protein [Candidatus Aminicenantes bacterium]NIM80435.1 hypothetical protein [Candidatus Aminicenantes bacterium]NIN19828.1 hypothetical protein [Candidatus Aminicenantes bacterium]NIN43704.1 hypothetical protein [Candidatus Aminicenantes bacterium]NIN86454.1 hypothetical protein [Candidatus Aminicenantes bacterium]
MSRNRGQLAVGSWQLAVGSWQLTKEEVRKFQDRVNTRFTPTKARKCPSDVVMNLVFARIIGKIRTAAIFKFLMIFNRLCVKIGFD